jgi:prevent-host-death family protein
MDDSGAATVDTPVQMPLRQAKARFSELVARADLVGTITILTKHGRAAAAIVPLAVLDDLAALRAELIDLRGHAVIAPGLLAQHCG